MRELPIESLLVTSATAIAFSVEQWKKRWKGWKEINEKREVATNWSCLTVHDKELLYNYHVNFTRFSLPWIASIVSTLPLNIDNTYVYINGSRPKNCDCAFLTMSNRYLSKILQNKNSYTVWPRYATSVCSWRSHIVITVSETVSVFLSLSLFAFSLHQLRKILRLAWISLSYNKKKVLNIWARRTKRHNRPGASKQGLQSIAVLLCSFPAYPLG